MYNQEQKRFPTIEYKQKLCLVILMNPEATIIVQWHVFVRKPHQQQVTTTDNETRSKNIL